MYDLLNQNKDLKTSRIINTLGGIKWEILTLFHFYYTICSKLHKIFTGNKC